MPLLTTDAMTDLKFAEPSHPNWFATMKTIQDEEVIDEDLFGSFVHNIDEFGDLV